MRKSLLLLLMLMVLFALDAVGSYAVSASSRRAEQCPGGGDECEMWPVYQVFLPIAAGAPMAPAPLTTWEARR